MRPIMVAVTALTASFLMTQPAAASASTASTSKPPASTAKPAASTAKRPALVNVTAEPRLPDGAREIGAVPAATGQSATIVLRPRNQSALTNFIGAVTDRQSPLFHQYLPKGGFASRFGPSLAAAAAVRSWLRSSGLRVTSVASDGLVINVSAPTASMERAFGTGLEQVKLASGPLAQATTGAIRLPSNIAGAVTSVVGLNSLVRLRPLSVPHPAATSADPRKKAKAPASAHPAGAPNACPDATKAATDFGGLTDDQIANAYGAFGLYAAHDTGAGQHIGVYELEQFLPSDIETFDTCYFGATAAAQMAKRLTIIPVDGGQPSGPGSGEASLDVEDISAYAPGADINVYEGASPGAGGENYDPIDPYVAMINADNDQVISTSWGLCEQAIQLGQPGLQQAENALFEQAAAQGQSIFSASGDNGSDDCNTYETATPVRGQNPVSVDDPGSQPYVVSAGGLAITDASQPPAEQVWNDGALGGGGGGGISMSWQMPSWQADSSVPGIVRPGAGYAQANKVEKQFGYPANFCQSYLSGATASTPCRTVPDVSAQADEFTGAITVYSEEYRSPQSPDGWTTTGGTSSAAPQWAAMLALVNASPTCAGNAATKNGVGFVSPLLYAVASNPAAYHASFTDVTAGNNDDYGLDDDQVFPATKGYDLASGLGSAQLTAPGDKAGLAFYLCSYGGLASRPAVTGLTPAVLPVAGGPVHISGSGFMPAGAHVTGLQVGSWQVPAGQFHVTSGGSITATFPKAADTVPPAAPRPQGGAGPATVIVTLSSGQSSAPGPASTLQYVDTHGSGTVPSVTGVIAYGGSENDPAPVTILGSGFAGATAVTFGGVSAKTFTILSPYEITLVPPAYSAHTSCSPLPSGGVYAGENAANDICQVQVRVDGAHGWSATSTIRPPLEGAISFNKLGALVAPPHCGCETAPAVTEYDYAPAPAITSVSTSRADPGSLASELGGTVITVTGRGFNALGVEWAGFGPTGKESSMDISFGYLTGTQMQVVAPAEPVGTGPVTVPFWVKSLGGKSAPTDVTYAGVPTVTSVLNTATGHNGAVDTGGAAITISGRGFSEVTGPVKFADVTTHFVNTQYSYTVRGGARITTEAVADNPGLNNVRVCSVTGCSAISAADQFYLYPPGNPAVTGIRPASGPAAGGTKVVITGQNLGCVTGVFFGTTAAKTYRNPATITGCGSLTSVDAVAPAGRAGAKVKVTVTTIESQFTGAGPSTSTAFFSYTS
jgi:hypothetical protein